MYLLLLYQMRDFTSMSRWNALALNWCNSVPCTFKTSRQRSCNQRVSCLQYLGSRAFEPSKRSCPRMLSTVPRGINRMTYLKDTEEDTAILFRRRDVRRKTGQITSGVSNLQKCKFSTNRRIDGQMRHVLCHGLGYSDIMETICWILFITNI